MLLTYDSMNLDELRGSTPADYLVSVDAGFRIVDRDDVVYEEPHFPVLELARSLLRWLEDPDRDDFVFDSMSFEELGAVYIRRTKSGWKFGSLFAAASSSSEIEWSDVERGIAAFVAGLEQELIALGVDPAPVLRH